MTTLRYKTFQGSVEFEDGHLIIQILHIDDFITTEVVSAKDAQAAFEELVDDYIETCKELGKPPCKPFSGSFNIRVSQELHRQVAWASADVGESMNAWVSAAIEGQVERQRARKAPFDREYSMRIIEAASFDTGYTQIVSIDAQDNQDNVLSFARARVSAARGRQ
jgi:predicted HicB family RNase H-like nuclease